jgi:hypothetical protein
MDAFGDHCRTAGERGGGEFRDGDQGVSNQRRIDHQLI